MKTVPKKVPWGRIREEYEATTISTKSLGKRYKVADSTVRAHRDKEGWERDVDAISAKLVTEAVLGIPDRNAQYDENRPREEGAIGAENEGQVIDEQGAIKKPDGADPIDERPQRSARHPPPLKLSNQTLRDREDERDLQMARSLANLQAKAIREQIQFGDDISALGMQIVSSINTVMLTDDPDERLKAQRGLLAINPDKDTMANLAKAALALVQGGVGLKRQAMGMDLVKKVPEPGDALRPPDAVNLVLQRLPSDALLQLRQVAIEVSKLPPARPQIEIEPEGIEP